MNALALPKVLTAEDDPIVRADLRLILTDAGFDVVPDARDGIEAVDLAREHRPDVILLDPHLPNADGVHALEERDVPIVSLTKPISEQQLVSTLREAISDHADLEAEQDHLRFLVERMQQTGRTEKEITEAVESESSARLRSRQTR